MAYFIEVENVHQTEFINIDNVTRITEGTGVVVIKSIGGDEVVLAGDSASRFIDWLRNKSPYFYPV
jgi:hypothetical protein